MAQLILIADDDPTQRRLLEGLVQGFGYQVQTAASGDEVVSAVLGDEGAFALILLDIVMPGKDGLAVLRELRPLRPTLPVIVLTAQGGIDMVVNAMKAGADDFIVKPVSPERLQVSIRNALKLNALTGEITRMSRRMTGTLTFDDLIAKSPAMHQVIRLGQRAAKSQIPILIEGESGVGKEIVARAIQGESERAGRPFVTVNCGAIPENLVESILFGHERGAFTGAKDRHNGKFQEANGGTLFLDEIGELPLDMQVKLLRALQEGEVDPVGARKPVRVDIRLISATNRNLTQLVEEGRFREDLYYRLNVFPINIAPLRERVEDIPELVHHFVARISVEEGKKVAGVEQSALEMLKRFPWPGNVRQLENAIFRAVVLTDHALLTVDDFPQIAHFATRLDTGERAPQEKAPTPASPQVPSEPDIAWESRAPVEASPVVTPTVPAHTRAVDHGAGINATLADGHLRTLQDIEGEVIRLALEHYRGHMSEVARRLGIGRSTLYRKVRELGLDKDAAEG